MKTREIEELLSTHADGLAAGQRSDQPHRATSSGVQPLLEVASRVHHRLTPVEPRPDFVASLWSRLQPSDVVLPASGSSQKAWIWIVAGVGGLISVASLAVILIHLISVILRRVIGPAGPPSADISSKAHAAT